MSQTSKLNTPPPLRLLPFNARLPGRVPPNDGRSKEARFCKRLREALLSHLGGRPSVTQSVLIDAAVDIALEIENMKAKRVENGALSQHDNKTFLGFVNAYRRHVLALGIKGTAQQPPTLQELMAASLAKAAA